MKLLAVAIIFLFIGMVIFPSSGIQIQNNPVIKSNRGNTLYVGGNGSGNYTKIQDAIDCAVDGDTVFVYDDSSPYNEWNIRINKSINLMGENRYNTIIDGNKKGDDVISITSNWVNVSGFTIVNGSSGIQTGYYNLIISDNLFINCFYGITISGGDESYIISNSFSKNCVAILANRYHSSEKQFVTISNNTIISSTENDLLFADIYCWDGNNYVIINNTLICNYPDGWRRGIELQSVSDSIIQGNEINGYEEDTAIYLDEESCNNTVSYNNITNNNGGLVIFDNDNKVINNNFINNNDGLFILGKNTRIINNNFINNENDAHIFIFKKNNLLDGNYWDRWIGNKIKLPFFQRFPMVIFGFLSFGIDWHPAKEPYDI